MKIAILSDIHGNMYAFSRVLEDMRRYSLEGVVLLGDLIDYGMQSNEVVDTLQDSFSYDIICNIWGNHERAILLEDFSGFSSQRGAECARYTASVLTEKTKRYLDISLAHDGKDEFILGDKRCLAVHGSMENVYWKAVSPDNVRGEYAGYDIVLSGHSHHPHVFTKFYDADNLGMRNKHAVLFLNPGSVGQPRNHNPAAQYALMDLQTMSVDFRAVGYDVDAATALYDGSVDDFYKIRLKKGV